MKKASVSDLRRSLAGIIAWVDAGDEVQITRRGKVIMRIVPSHDTSSASMPGLSASLDKLARDSRH